MEGNIPVPRMVRYGFEYDKFQLQAICSSSHEVIRLKSQDHFHVVSKNDQNDQNFPCFQPKANGVSACCHEYFFRGHCGTPNTALLSRKWNLYHTFASSLIPPKVGNLHCFLPEKCMKLCQNSLFGRFRHYGLLLTRSSTLFQSPAWLSMADFHRFANLENFQKQICRFWGSLAPYLVP